MNLPESPVVMACSGLGHVRRGNETWALDVAQALHAAGQRVVLVGGGPLPGVTCPYVRLPHFRRDLPVLRQCVPWAKRYLIEQLTFLVALRRYLRRWERVPVHLCDPDLALQLHRRSDPTRVRVAFKDGMLLGPEWCRRLPFVQVLAPYYRDVVARDAGVDTREWVVIPHLVDGNAFRPAPDRARARCDWVDLGLPPEAFVVLGVGDFSPQGNKRLPWLIDEVASLPAGACAHLVLAGQASPADLAALEAVGRPRLGARLHLLPNRSRAEVARLYAVADVFAHAATREPFGIVLLEALASGLPVIGHPWEVTRWIIGDAGQVVDMTRRGELGALLQSWGEDAARRRAMGDRARRRALDHFSAAGVVPQYGALHQHMRTKS